MSRTTILVVIVLGIVIAGASWASFSAGTPVDVGLVTTGTIRTYIEERAKTRLPEIYRITMPESGRVLPITLKERDDVTKGEVVAMLEAADFETAVAEALAHVQQLKNKITENQDNRLENNAILGFDEFLKSMAAAVESARLQTTASNERFKFAETEFRRKTKLFEEKAITDSDRNEAELFEIESRIDYQKDVLTLRSLQAVEAGMKIGRQSIIDYIDKKSLERDVLEQEQKEAEARLQRAERDLARTKIVSPVDGIVLQRHISNERVLSAGELLLEVGRLDDLQVEAEILTVDVINIHPGDRVEIEGPGIGARPTIGTVAKIYPQGFTKVSSLGVEQQRVLVVIDFAPGELQRLSDEGHHLGNEYRVRVKIFTAQKEKVIKAPRPAVFRGEHGGWQAFVVKEGIARLTDLELGLRNDFEVEILSGAGEGDQLILAPEASLSAGTRVDPIVRE